MRGIIICSLCVAIAAYAWFNAFKAFSHSMRLQENGQLATATVQSRGEKFSDYTFRVHEQDYSGKGFAQAPGTAESVVYVADDPSINKPVDMDLPLPWALVGIGFVCVFVGIYMVYGGHRSPKADFKPTPQAGPRDSA